MFLKTTLLFMASVLCWLPVCAQKSASRLQSAAPARAKSLLKLREPQVKWNTRNMLKADFDYDGVEDYALGGVKAGKYVIGIVKSPLAGKTKHWTLEFRKDAGGQDGLCSIKAQIRLEELKGEEIPSLRNVPAKSRGINLYDDLCDSFHIFWDVEAKRFQWWRH